MIDELGVLFGVDLHDPVFHQISGSAHFNIDAVGESVRKREQVSHRIIRCLLNEDPSILCELCKRYL